MYHKAEQIGTARRKILDVAKCPEKLPTSKNDLNTAESETRNKQRNRSKRVLGKREYRHSDHIGRK